MFEIKYRIPREREEEITGALGNAGENSFSVENRDGILYVVFYSEFPDPVNFPVDIMPEEIRDIGNWRDRWAQDYLGSELTGDIFVRPAGGSIPEKIYSLVINLDPLDAFGDGHHPTTRLCASLLQEYLDDFPMEGRAELSMIDVGTGTGILAITACLSGVGEVELFDYDPLSVQKASFNAGLNGIDGLRPFQADLYDYRFKKKYDLITANLLTNLIEDNILSLSDALVPGGVLIISGIGEKWTDDMIKLFSENNLAIRRHKILEGWNGFALSHE